MKEFWNQRYGEMDYAYGEEPNHYLVEKLTPLEAGTILFPAEGEGRNAVFAAQLGWDVSAFDISVEGRNKALKLAENRGVSIDYQVGEWAGVHFKPEQFDAIALIYAHFPNELKSSYHKAFAAQLRQGGIVIFEAFSKRQVDYNSKNEKVGGPKDPAMLASIEEIRADFDNFDIIELEEREIELSEGLYHNGLGSVIRFVGRKK